MKTQHFETINILEERRKEKMAFTYTYTGTEDWIIDIRFKEKTRIVTFQNSGTFEVTYHNERVFRFLKSAHVGDCVLVATHNGEIKWIKYN